ncbi:hypothetical protein C8R43DRAFT_60482 [Mycena crocata]|nr:hypothetical protein C8R43DRAFT_60482 [Mycena crocata]
MSRRSARLTGVSNKPLIQEESIDSDEEDFPGEEEPEFVPPKKKQRKAGKPNAVATDEDQRMKKVRGRRGLLSSLKEFPLDVLFEIFGHLNPVDLLHLARTTKEIRGILMSRSTAFIWKEARSHVEGLPDLPPDLSEPQYANLAFDGHCHKCFVTPVQTIIWSARTRMCRKCISLHFDTWSGMVSTSHIEASLVHLIPSFEDRRSGRRRWHKPLLYSTDVATELSEKCAEFKIRGVLQTKDPKYLEWYKHKTKETEERNAHAALCTVWHIDRTSNRSNELDDTRQLRREAIEERLTALGWGEEIPFHTYEFSNHKLVKQPKELTDRIWKNIESPLVEFLTDLKKARLEIEHSKILRERRNLAARVYRAFRDTFPPDTVFPPDVDVIRTEPFRVVIEETSIHPEEKVTDESFTAAIASVPQTSVEWKERKDQELVQIMRQSVPAAVETDLNLATTFFMCSTSNGWGAGEAIGYPRILVHSATTSWGYRETYEPAGADHDLKTCLGANSWNAAGNIRFHEKAYRIAKFVVKACALDPDVTTRAEMDEINPVMECLDCSGGPQGRMVMRWIQTTAHMCGINASWKCLTREEEPPVEVEERDAFINDVSTFSYRWQEGFCCRLCDRPKTSYSNLKSHLHDAHSIDTVSLDHVKFHIDVSISTIHPRPVRLKLPVLDETKEAEVQKKGDEGPEAKEAEGDEGLDERG